jgi:hypothetical protein
MKTLFLAALIVIGLAGGALAGDPNARPTGLNPCDLEARGLTVANNDSGCLAISGGFSYRASASRAPSPYAKQPSEKQRVTGTTGKRNE